MRREDAATRPGDRVPIDSAVFDGPREGSLKRMAAAERLARYACDVRAGAAIRRARDGEEGASFRAADGAVRHLRRVEG